MNTASANSKLRDEFDSPEDIMVSTPVVYLVQTTNRGILLQPAETWGGDSNFNFTISGRADSDYVNTKVVPDETSNIFVHGVLF